MVDFNRRDPAASTSAGTDDVLLVIKDFADTSSDGSDERPCN